MDQVPHGPDAAPPVEIPYLSSKLPMHHRSGNQILKEARETRPSLNSHKRRDIHALEEEAKLLAPRQYQIELLEKALSRNVIAVLETGAGKTLVAVMLLKEMVLRHVKAKEANPETCHRVGIFLVNLVPLVFQQARVIEANIPYRVEKLCGEMGVDFWDVGKWKETIANNDVLVMTAQIFLNMLRHAYIRMDDISILSFDECHHTQKNHPYNLVMKEFYHPIKAGHYRPKIFGMTASPLGGRVGAIAAAGSLELALDAQIYTVCTQDELRSFVSHPKEIVAVFAPSPRKYLPGRLISLIQSECSASKFIQDLSEAAIEVAFQLGPWCALLLFRTSLDELKQNNFSTSSVFTLDRFTPSMLALEEGYVNKALSIYDQYKVQLKGIDPLDSDPIHMDSSHVSPKAQMLLTILRASHKVPDFYGIVFAERRCVAYTLKLMIDRVQNIKFIRCGHLIGHGGSKGSRSMQMNFTQQNRMIRDFKSGVFNLLVATNVAEEGLDIQPCNMVIRFDFFTSLISYIQSRGRARQRKSAYVLMQERGNIHEESLLRQLQRAESEMLNWCQSLPEDRFRQFSTQDLYSTDESDASLANSHIYRVPETGATITLESSTQLLFNFCSLLPKDDYCIPLPTFRLVRQSQYFKCTLKLPPNCPLKTVFGELALSKARATQSCAFKACVQLHKLGSLNDNLLPIKDESELTPDDFDPIKKFNEDGTVEGSWLAQHQYEAKTPDFWVDDGYGWRGFYINTVNSQDSFYRPLAIITRKPLPRFNPLVLYFKGEPANILVVPSVSIPFTTSQITELMNFTTQAFFAILRKNLQCDINNVMYLLAPLLALPSAKVSAWDSIDWDLVRSAGRTTPIDYTTIPSEAIICDVADNFHRYYVKGIKKHLGPHSQVPGFEGEAPTFVDFYARRFKKEVRNMRQPVLEVERIALAYNYLTRGAKSTKKGYHASYLLPEFCRTYWLPASVLRSIMLIPSLMMRIDALLLVKEIQFSFDIGFVNTELLLEAFTHTTANVSMDYERLELLGDSYLKFIASLDVFIRFPKKHEGQLHCQRVRIIGNRTMYWAAKERNLPAYFITQPFNRRIWCPPNIKFENCTSAAPVVRFLSDKCLADVVEASLGASLLSAGRSKTLACAKALGIPIGEIYCWDDFQRNYVPLEQPDTYISQNLLDVLRIETIIGYTFKNPSLLVEAFTHASYPHAVTPSYQRLEFLGDAVLDYFVVSYLFHKYPKVSPGCITEMKDACVSNNTLAAIMETLGLHRHILHFSNKLMHAMEDFIHIMSTLRKQWEDAKDTPMGEYWFDINAPKVISDVLEAIIGAVFVDSQFDFDAPHGIFLRHIQPLFDKHIAPNLVIVHPTIQLTRFIHRFGCQKLEIICTTLDDEEKLVRPKEEHVTCTIKVHGQIIAIHSGVVVKAARKYAAQDVLDRIKADPKLIHPICDCPSRHTAVDTNATEGEDDEE